MKQFKLTAVLSAIFVMLVAARRMPSAQAVPAAKSASLVSVPAASVPAVSAPPVVSGLLPAAATLGERPLLDLQIGHSKPVRSVAFSPDGKTVASGGEEGLVKLWDTRTGDLKRTLQGHNIIFAVAFSPDGKTVAAGSNDSTIRLWDARTGRLQRTLAGQDGSVLSIAFSPDGKTIAAGTAEADQSETHGIKLWNVQTGALQRVLAGHKGQVAAVAFSPDGTVLASGGWDGIAWLWDARTGRLRRTLEGHTTGVNAVAFSPDSKTLATGAEDEIVKLWNVASGAVQRTLIGHGGAITAVAFAPDGKTLASGSADSTIKLWDARTGKIRSTLTEGPEGSPVNAVAFSPDGRTLAGGRSDKVVRLWDIHAGRVARMLIGPGDMVGTVAFSPDGRMLATANGTNEGKLTGAIKLWNTRTGELLRSLPGRGVLAFSPDSSTLASMALNNEVDEHQINLWDVRSGQLKRTLAGHKIGVAWLAFAPDGKTLASAGAGAQGAIKLWNVQTAALRRTWQSGNDKSLAFSPDGRTLAGTRFNGPVHIWATDNGALNRILAGRHDDSTSVAFSPDGRTLAVGDGSGRVELWDVRGGKLRHTLVGHRSLVTAVAFSSDGEILASGSWDKTVRLWDVATGRLRSILAGHSDSVSSVAFSPNGKTLVSSSWDGTVKFWKPQTGRLLATIVSLAHPPTGKPLIAVAKPLIALAKASDDAEEYIVVTPEGYYTGSTQAERYVRFRVDNRVYPVESFQARFYRPDLVQRALAGEQLPLANANAVQHNYPPLVSFLSPSDGEQVDGNSLTVTLEAVGASDIERLDLFVNGARVNAKAIIASNKALIAYSKPIPANSRDLPPAYQASRRFEATIPLPPDTSVKLQVIAYDHNGLQSPRDEILLTHQGVATGDTVASGKLLGLCVGISRYADAQLNLHYADRDAADLAAMLNHVPVGPGSLYSAANVTTLTNEQATCGNIEASLDDLIAHVTAADTVVLLLSGHGWRSDERNFYFATREVNRRDVTHTALPWREVVQRLARLSEKSRRTIVLLDACHSGSAATNEELVTDIVHGKAGVLVLASSRGSEVSLELPQQGHGAFTEAVLEGMKGQAAENGKDITTLDFLSYVARRVMTLTENQQHPSVPYLQDFDTDAVILRMGETGP